MTVNPALAVQAALHDCLAADAGLLALLGGPGVYDDVPPKRTFPYVTFGDIETRDWSTQGKRGFEHIVTLNIWSGAAGRKQAYDIIAAIDAAIETAPLTVTGFTAVNQRLVFWTALREPDAETYRGVARLRIVTEPEI